jgi:predicted GIY-YIG superfamily endonuclease
MYIVIKSRIIISFCFLMSYSCYCLYSLNTKYLSETYVGVTNDLERRLRQHNGELVGGAKKTKKRRPWEYAIQIHGFTNQTMAMKFEFAWQQPHRSRYFKDYRNNTGCKLNSDWRHRSYTENKRILDLLLSFPQLQQDFEHEHIGIVYYRD